MVNQIFKNKTFLPIIQFVTLLGFVLLIYGAIGVTTSDKDFAIILRNTNLANLIVWSYWWPFIIVTAILFGRFWCTICPMELITSFFARIGLKRKPGNVLKSGWFTTLFYATILILGIHTLAIHRIPQLMAIYMLILFLASVIVGLIWEKRTFCTYVCPVGHLLGLYSMISAKKLRVKDKEVCQNCKTKDCISKANHYNFIGRSCTSELYPATIQDNRNCILCGQCHKSCTKDNIAIQKRKFGEDLFKNIKLSWAEIAFFMMLSSFVIYEILSEWKPTKHILLYFPNLFYETFNITGNAKGTIKAIILFVILPTFFYFLFALLKRYLAKENFKLALTQLVMAILPITASMHLLKALLKTLSRIPYWEYVFSDPKGVETAQLIMNNSDVIHKSVLGTLSPIISIIAILLSLAGIIFSFLVIRKQKFANNLSKLFSVISVLIYSFLFLIALIAWRFI